MYASRRARRVLVVTFMATVIAGCGKLGDTADGDGGESKNVSKMLNTDEEALQDEIGQEAKVKDPSGSVKPKLNEVTAPRGEPATSLMSDWLEEGTVKEMIPPPTQPMD